MGDPFSLHTLIDKFLVSKGIRVDVLTTNAGQIEIGNKEWQILQGINIKYMDFYGGENFNFSPKYFFETFKIIKDYDVIHITAIWNFPVIAGYISSIIKNKPFLVSPTGALYEESVNAKRKIIKKIYFNTILKMLIKKASAIQFTSLLDKERFLSLRTLK